MARFALPEPRTAIRLGQSLAPGTVVPAAQTHTELSPIAGARTVRVRFKASAEGNLTIRPTLADGETPVSDIQDTAPVAADTELVLEVTNLAGEPYLLIEFQAGAAPATIAYCDLFQL
jgi:hypothetical protein